MSSINKILSIALPVALIAFLFLPGCGGKADGGSEGEKGSGMRPVTRVRVMEITQEPFIKKVHLLGMARAWHMVTVSSEESGVVKKLYFDKGAYVKKGDLLLALDDAQLKSRLNESTASLEMSRINFNKLTALKKGGGAVSDFDLKNAELKMDMAKAQAEAVSLRLDKMSLKSPSNGYIDRKYVEEGELLSPGKPLAEIVDISRIRVEVSIPEKDISSFNAGSEASVIFDSHGDKIFAGKLDYIAASVDPSAGTVKSEVYLSNKEGLLKPGMSAIVTIVRETCAECILIPQDAMVETENGNIVFIVDTENRARAVNVSVADTNKDKIVIGKGLNPGDRVIIVGHRDLVDGEEVEVVNKTKENKEIGKEEEVSKEG